MSFASLKARVTHTEVELLIVDFKRCVLLLAVFLFVPFLYKMLQLAESLVRDAPRELMTFVELNDCRVAGWFE
jgi:hypothetical protein